ncbi:hypothetical protein, partial [Asaia bogorensis]|uniref:hypothetical protein n=1 Tax=Asaia bogorensis TaxID=91915 RepID=UPI00222F7A47
RLAGRVGDRSRFNRSDAADNGGRDGGSVHWLDRRALLGECWGGQRKQEWDRGHPGDQRTHRLSPWQE